MTVFGRDRPIAGLVDADGRDPRVGGTGRDGEIAVGIGVDVGDRPTTDLEAWGRAAGADVTFDLPDGIRRRRGLLLIRRWDHGAARAATSRTGGECGCKSNREPSIASHYVTPPRIVLFRLAPNLPQRS
jgi:hypothetical protein